MDSHQTIELIKRALIERKNLGDTSVTIDSLESYLEHLKDSRYYDTPEQHLQTEEHTHQWNVEMVRSGVEAGGNALKTCLLISGGSAAALLAFASSAWSGLKAEGLEALGVTLAYLSIAILLTGAATATRYLSQYFFAERLSWHRRAGNYLQWFTCALVLAAYIFVSTAFLKASYMITMFKVVKFIPVS